MTPVRARPVVTLGEWQTVTVPALVLTLSDERLAAQLAGPAGRVDVDALREGVRIHARSWVGVVGFDRFELRIVPKLAGDHAGLIEMLALTTGLDALRRNAGVRQLAAEPSVHLADLLALVFAEACHALIGGGLIQDYLVRDDDLPVVRGRLHVARQVRRRFGRVDRLECVFDERDSNVIENQLLLASAAACRRCVRHPAVRRRVEILHGILAEACAPTAVDVTAPEPPIVYNRLNAHYREAHAVAWLILRAMHVRDLFAVGDVRGFAFLLDMNALFERFVDHVVRRCLTGRPYTVHSQRRDRSILRDITEPGTPRSHGTVIPDLLVTQPGAESGHRLPIDAKYKLYDEQRISPADIYQAFVYAFAYGDPEAVSGCRAILVFPAGAGASPLVRTYEVRPVHDRPGARIHALPLSIPAVLADLAGTGTGSSLAQMRWQVEEAMGGAQARTLR